MKNLQTSDNLTRAFLVGGILAGPIFILVIVAQIFTRNGFNFVIQPISLLSLGDLGWIQMVDFILGGILVVGLAIGIRKVLHPGPAGTWGAWLVGGFGLGLIVAGLFPPDPAFGFPPGTPSGMPAVMSYHSAMHGIGFTLSFTALTVACLVVARRDAIQKQWGGAAYSIASAIACLTLSMWPGMQGASVRYFVAAIIAWSWTSVLALRLLRAPHRD